MSSIFDVKGESLSKDMMKSVYGGAAPGGDECSSANCDIPGGSSYTCKTDAMGNCGCKGTNTEGEMVVGDCPQR